MFCTDLLCFFLFDLLERDFLFPFFLSTVLFFLFVSFSHFTISFGIKDAEATGLAKIIGIVGFDVHISFSRFELGKFLDSKTHDS